MPSKFKNVFMREGGRKGGKERERVSEHASSVDLWNLLCGAITKSLCWGSNGWAGLS